VYRTCLHCHAALGANDVIEHFPVGGRLAYDEAKGRLWVVCGKCRRWNLTPLEERWEAIEECEREFEKTRLRASTDNVVLARVRGGLDLVRIGKPSLPEISAWRYGRALVDRWRRQLAPTAALLTGVYGMQVLTQAEVVGFGAGIGLMALFAAPGMFSMWRTGRVKVLMPNGRVTTVKHRSKEAVALEADGESGWTLRIEGKDGTTRTSGVPALHAMRGLLTAVNFNGGKQADVDSALSLVQRAGDTSRYIANVAAVAGKHGSANVNFLPPDVRLGLEIALHEDSERLAMQGELGLLRDEWQLAEEVAGISDNMFLSESVMAKLEGFKRDGGQ
jgi:hypothetical protein